MLHVSSFSKSVLAVARIATLSPPQTVAVWAASGRRPVLAAAATRALACSPHGDVIAYAARDAAYRERRDALMTSMARHLPADCAGPRHRRFLLGVTAAGASTIDNPAGVERVVAFAPAMSSSPCRLRDLHPLSFRCSRPS